MIATVGGGVSVVPIDTSIKRPYSKLLPVKTDDSGDAIYSDSGNPKRTWKPFQNCIADPETVQRWATDSEAFAVVCGSVSDGVEILDFDVAGYYEDWKESVNGAVDGLVIQRTGGGGFQVAYRCPKPDGNQKLAWHIGEDGKKEIAIETRGEGGYAVIAPSLHPSGNRYEMIQGSFAAIPTITMAQRNALIDAAKSLCKKPMAQPQPTTATLQPSTDNPHVIDAFNEKYKPVDVMLKYGFTHNGGDRWSRPDQPESMGVSVMPDGKTFHYSSNDDLDSDYGGKSQPRSAFDFYLEYEHHGDYKAAVRALAPEFGLDYQSRERQLLESFKSIDTSTGEVTEKVITPENITQEIEQIGDDVGQVRERLAAAVGTVPSSAHVEIEAALVEHCKLSKTEAKEFTRACRRDTKERKRAAAQQRREEIAERRVTDRGARPAIQINNVQDRDILSDVKSAVVAINKQSPNHPILYTSGGRLSRVVTVKDEDQIGGIGKSNQLDSILFDVADYVSVTSDADGNPQEVDASLPQRITKAYLGRGDHPELPELQGTTYAPTVTEDGTIHTQPAYNPVTKLYYSQPVEIGELMPVKDAVDYIDAECFSNFPFKESASKAHTFECMLLPFVREAIKGPTPLHTFDSPVAGTGKSKLAKVCMIPALGRIPAAENEPARNEDWGKELTTTLVKGKPYVFLDNIKRNVDSGALASCLTETEREDRRFGTNDEALRYSIRQVWIMTGNNLHLDYEIARRSLWIRIESEHEKPHERDISQFRHPNLTKWALENRAELVTACLSIIQHWIDEGMPRFTDRAKGSYEEWSEIMGGILQAAGIDGFLENEQQLIENAVDEVETWNEFVNVWIERHSESNTSTKDLFKIASHSDDSAVDTHEYLDILADELGAGKEQSRKIKLGRKLKEMRGRVIAGHRIERGPTIKGSPQWRLEPVNQSESRTLIL